MIATAKRSNLYHSALREMTQDGPVRLQVLEEVRESKWAGKPCYCLIKLENEEAGRYLQVENDEVRATLDSAPRGSWLSVVALGSRETAVLEVVSEEAAAAPVANRIARDIRQVVKDEDNAPGSISGEYWRTLRMAQAMVAAFKKEFGAEPSEAERAIATTLFIERCRSGRPLSA